MNNKLFIIPLVLFLMTPIANAQIQNTTTFCVTNQTLTSINSVFIERTGSQDRTITASFNMTCSFGCDELNNVCNPNPFNQSLIFLVAIGGIIVVGVLFIRGVTR